VSDVIVGSTQHSAFSGQQKQSLPLRQAQGQDDAVVGSTENRELRTENFIASSASRWAARFGGCGHHHYWDFS